MTVPSTLPPKYNPAFASDDNLNRFFVVRQRYVDLILETVRENNGQSNQHILIVGPRGIGKTTLVRKVAAEVRQASDLQGMWYPVLFAEEAYEISTTGEFWLEALGRLADQTNSKELRAAYLELKAESDDIRLRERSLSQVLGYAEASQKRLLFIVENLNMLLGEQLSDRAAWDLRHTLLNENRVMLIATALSRFAQIDNAGKAWFELFTIYTLEPLTAQECNEVFRATTGHGLPPGQARAMQILTGGNPRLVRVLAEFSSKRSFRDLLADLIHLVDEHTEYFKSQIDSLPAVERKVFVALLDVWEPVMAQDIAKNSRLTASKASALLNRLVSRGAVTVVGGPRRKKLYQATERLYNIYYLLRRHGHPSARVRAAVRFMTVFYRRSQLIQSTADLAKEACALGASDSRADHFAAYQEILTDPQSSTIRSAIIRATPIEFFSFPELPDEIRRVRELDRKQGDAHGHGADTSEDLHSLLTSAQAKQEGGDWVMAEAMFRKVVEAEPNYGHGWAHLAVLLYKKLDRYEEAAGLLDKALRLQPSDAWALMHRGMLALQMGSDALAADALRRCVELEPGEPWSWLEFAHALHNVGEYKQSERACRKAIELGKSDILQYAWSRLAELYHYHLGRDAEAEKAYAEALSLAENDTGWVWMNYAAFLRKQNRADEARRYVDMATTFFEAQVKSAPNNASALSRLGTLYSSMPDKFTEAEASLRKATQLDPKERSNWERFAGLYFNLSKWEDAEGVYLAAVEAKPDQYEFWGNLAWVRERRHNLDGAELAYRRAVELSPHSSEVIAPLARLLVRQRRFSEALPLASKLFDLASDKEGAVERSIDLAIALSSSGFAREVLKRLQNSKGKIALEPLEVGLRESTGEEVVAPKEISEVAHDIAERIASAKKKNAEVN